MKTTVCLNALERAIIEPAGDGIAVTFTGVLTIRRLIHYKDAATLSFLLSDALIGRAHPLKVQLAGGESIACEPIPAGVLMMVKTKALVLPRRLTREAAEVLAWALDQACEALETAAERAHAQKQA